MSKLKQSQSRAVLPTISTVTFLGFLDTHLLIPVMALYAHGLGASVGIIGLIIGLSLSIVSLIILPSVVIFPLLASAMALYGIAYGILFPSISALVADQTIPKERGMATGMFHAFLTAGVALGAPTMGWAGEMARVKLGLILSSCIMVLALSLVLKALRRQA